MIRAKEPPPVTWAYGLTTVPNRAALLRRTLRSLAEGGFPEPLLFLDGADHRQALTLEQDTGLTVVSRPSPPLRPFGNWALALAELYIRQPTATYYALFQDDFVTYVNLRQYLEACPFPEKGYWNLITFLDNEKTVAGTGTGWHESGSQAAKGKRKHLQTGRGAVALVFNQAGVLELLTGYRMLDRPRNLTKGWRNLDGGIVNTMNAAGFREYVHNPSLVQHVGTESTLPAMKGIPADRSDGLPRRRWEKVAQTFRGEGFDCLELLKEINGVG